MILSALIACTPQPPPAVDYRAAFGEDPTAVTEVVRQMSDPIEQEIVVIALCEAYPGYTAELCAALPAGAARTRCERFNARPHLWSITDTAPASGRLGLPSDFTQLWDDTAPDPGPCREDDHGCIEARVRELATSGKIDAVAQTCRSFADARLENDCFFAASELVTYGEDLYERAMPLCAGSGRYAHECHGHVLLRMRADDPEAPSAERLLEEEASVLQLWSEHDAGFGAKAVDLYWSTAAARSIGTALPFPSALTESLPERVMPHLRSAVALRVINEADPIARAREAMSGVEVSLPRAFMPPVMPEARLWLGSQAGDLPLERISFNDVRGGQRPVHPDADVDLHFAVMTAVAMRSPPRRDVLEGLRLDPRPPVRWGASRLLGELRP